jgi:flavin-binding protein dodecin
MSVAKVIEISSLHPKSFEEAIREGLARAAETTRGIRGAWVSEQHVEVREGKITGYRVNLRITFMLEDPKKSKKR